MKNVYHILHQTPAFEPYEMYRETEALAQGLVKSGLMRVDADPKRNFVYFSISKSGISVAFSHREITDPALIGRTKEIIISYLQYAGYKNIERELDLHWGKLHRQMETNVNIPLIWEERLARLIVQSAEPVVTQLILIERVEVFISFGFEVGDVMDVQSWKVSGKNSGLQSTDGVNSAVYVSCGGNPFIVNKEQATFVTDGYQALARTMIIAGQEMGHYADILRNNKGQKVSRHSADFGGRRAKPHVKRARQHDIARCDAIREAMRSFGLARLANYDHEYRHYRKFKIKSRNVWLVRLKMKIMGWIFKRKCRNAGLYFIDFMRKEECLGAQMVIMLADMRFNLAPKADVYSRDDPEEEDAIACIEALARVPQQVNKWGHAATGALMHELYHIYYDEVIPSCIEAVEFFTKDTYRISQTKQRTPLWIKLKKLVGKGPKKPEIAPLYVD